ncbi:MAG: hypothetical protein P857_1090 [Candidatus Xenolissoclinum pacificiensis L6]|uniref:Uncharacterized protein n=1 Tax=Candidatus Xenolissoclinum pacificiensis L6 TaxID=1401685 RepID=W2V1B6_9RICK|nr:MAG: hypothetical protein P857_1090 [Candidatus Xenolissoclinum pacificiensis L6]
MGKPRFINIYNRVIMWLISPDLLALLWYVLEFLICDIQVS